MQQIGRYQIVGRIAAGGMAEVFLARTVGPAGITKTCVIKRILPTFATNAEFVTLFLNEARLSAQLQHPNIVQFIEVGESDGAYFLAMEYVDGPTIRGLMRGGPGQGPLDLPVSLKIASQALEGLQYAHAFVDEAGRPQRVVHRDISPHNILLGRNGSVRVADFGIARAASLPSITKTGQVRGKLRYMSPEQLEDRPLDGRSDLFAMGITLFEMLAGVRPFDRETDAEAMMAILEAPTPRLSDFRGDVPAGLQQILERALEKDADARYPTAAAMQSDLEGLLVRMGAVVRGAEIAALIAARVPNQPEPVTVFDEPAASTPPANEVPPSNEVARAPPAASRPAQPTLTDPSEERTPQAVPATRVDPRDTARAPRASVGHSRGPRRALIGLLVGAIGVGLGLGVWALDRLHSASEPVVTVVAAPRSPPRADPGGSPPGDAASAVHASPQDEAAAAAPVLDRPAPSVAYVPEPPPEPTRTAPGRVRMQGSRNGFLITPRGTVQQGGRVEDVSPSSGARASHRAIAPRGHGTLVLHITPRAAVAVDDVDKGVVSEVSVRLRAGRHLVRVWAVSGQNQSIPFWLAPNETKSMHFNF